MEPINGKFYPMWSQFVDKKENFIGREMIETDNLMGAKQPTLITDVTLEPNGIDSAMISFHGQHYSFGVDVKHLGIGAKDTYPGYLNLTTFFGCDLYIGEKKVL